MTGKVEELHHASTCVAAYHSSLLINLPPGLNDAVAAAKFGPHCPLRCEDVSALRGGAASEVDDRMRRELEKWGERLGGHAFAVGSEYSTADTKLFWVLAALAERLHFAPGGGRVKDRGDPTSLSDGGAFMHGVAERFSLSRYGSDQRRPGGGGGGGGGTMLEYVRVWVYVCGKRSAAHVPPPCSSVSCAMSNIIDSPSPSQPT